MSAGIDAQLTVAEVIDRWPATAAVFVRRCMACVGCVMAPFDTIGDAAAVYGIELEGILDELRRLSDGDAGGRR